MPEPRYAGVMFDLGGTLFHDLPVHITERNQRAALCAAGIPAGDVPATAALVGTFDDARQEAETELRRRGFYRHADLVRCQFVIAARRIGAPPNRLEHAADYYFNLQRIGVQRWLRPRPDCHGALAALKRMGCDLSIVSNNDDGYLQYLVKRWHLDQYLRAWVSSDAAGSCKPASEIFAAGLAGSGLEPGAVLYVGDSLSDDVAGARGAGLDVAWFNPAGSPALHGEAPETPTTYEIDTLAALVPLVAR